MDIFSSCECNRNYIILLTHIMLEILMIFFITFERHSLNMFSFRQILLAYFCQGAFWKCDQCKLESDDYNCISLPIIKNMLKILFSTFFHLKYQSNLDLGSYKHSFHSCEIYISHIYVIYMHIYIILYMIT